MENLLTTIGEKFKFLRKKKKLTQVDVAELLNVSPSTYAKMERGETDITINRLEEIAKLFETTGLEVMKLGENLGNTQNNNQNNNYSLINNSTISVPTNQEETKEILRKLEIQEIIIQNLTKRIEILENTKK